MTERNAKCRILLVDDHRIMREVVEEMRRHMGYSVATAKDGVEALEIEANGPLDGGA